MIALKEQIKLVPEKPGIYKYFDKNSGILYIGKAKNLKKRVASYFTSKASHSGRIKVLVSKIARVEFTVVESESEALLLENSLIKKLQPKYNVRLKDGKTYPMLAIKNERFPRLFPLMAKVFLNTWPKTIAFTRLSNRSVRAPAGWHVTLPIFRRS